MQNNDIVPIVVFTFIANDRSVLDNLSLNKVKAVEGDNFML